MAPTAMVNLGVLEKEQGNQDRARHWWELVVATGHPDVASDAQQELRALDRHEDDRRRGEHFGRYGYLAYADPALMNQDNHPRTSPADQHGSSPGPDDGVISDDN